MLRLTSNAVPTLSAILPCCILTRFGNRLEAIIIETEITHRSLHRLASGFYTILTEDVRMFCFCVRVAEISTHTR